MLLRINVMLTVEINGLKVKSFLTFWVIIFVRRHHNEEVMEVLMQIKSAAAVKKKVWMDDFMFHKVES